MRWWCVARIRDPARDKAFELWKEAGGEKASKGVLKEIADKLGLSEGTVRGWKAKDKWNVPIKKGVERSEKNMERSNKKNLINQAKSMVVSGATIKEAADQTGLKESTLKNYAAKENWMELQEKFLKKVYGKLQEEKGEEHIKRRIESIDYLNYVQKRTLATITQKKEGEKNTGLSGKDIESIKAYETVANIIMKTIKGQSELLGIPDMKLNIRADKNKEGGEKLTSIQEVRKKNDL